MATKTDRGGVFRAKMLGRLLLLTLVVAAFSLPGSAYAARADLTCGATITVSTKLHHDLVDCPSNGIVIGADNVTLDLNGHTVDGDANLVDACPGEQLCDVGIANSEGHKRVTVRGGSVRDFATGVHLLGGEQNDLRHLSVTRSFFAGIVVVNSSGKQVKSSIAADNGLTTDSAGVVLFTSRGACIEGNRLSGNGDAGLFAAQADDSLVEGNAAVDNTNAGIAFEGSGNELSRKPRRA
jgi:parallel beta-helix repeat protein